MNPAPPVTREHGWDSFCAISLLESFRLFPNPEGQQDEWSQHLPPVRDWLDFCVGHAFGARVGLGDGDLADPISQLENFPVDVIFKFVRVEPGLFDVNTSVVEN